MYKEQCDQARQHETLRQQSTTLIFALAGTMGTVAGVVATLTTSKLLAEGMHWVFLLYAPLGILITSMADFGRHLSLKHYERNRHHIKYASLYRKRLEAMFPDANYEALRKKAESEHKSEWPKESKVKKGLAKHIYDSNTFRFWRNMYYFLMGVGILLIILPLSFGLYPQWVWLWHVALGKG
jgi:hypothetical protein